MKQIFKLLFVGFYITVMSNCLYAQEKLTVFLGGGTNAFKSDAAASEFINPDLGFNIGFFQPLLKRERFNIGLNLSGAYNFANKEFSNLNGIIPIIPLEGLTTSNVSNKVGQSLMQLGLGPQLNFKLSNKFWVSPIVQAGYFNFNQDEIAVNQDNTIETSTLSNIIFTQNAVNQGGLFVKPALRLSYQFTEKWSIWGEGNYFLANVNTTQNTLVPLGQPNEQGQFNFRQLIDRTEYAVRENKTSLNTVGIFAGLAYSFGERKKKDSKESSQVYTDGEVTDCTEKIKLVYPKSSKEFVLEDKDFPTAFSWQKSDFKKAEYVFRLFKGEELIYTKETKNNSIETRNFKEKLVESKEDVKFEYSWNVTVINPECEEYTTNSNSFGLRSSTQAAVNIVSVKCKSPAYDGEGKVHYELEFSVAFASTNLQWRINNFQIYALNNSGNSTLITPTTPFNPALPITLTSLLLSANYTVDIAVPVGTSGIDVVAIGQMLNLANQVQANLQGDLSAREEKIDNCICNFCDDIKISVDPVGNGGNFISIPNSDNDAFLEKHTLNVTTSSGDPVNVVAVDVEIVAYQHYDLSNEQCIACNNKKSQHGTFFNHIEGGVNQSNLITGNFYSSQAIYNNPNGPSGRSVRWQSANPNGTNITNVQTNLAVGLPQLINSCCSDCFRMSFRYTFTIKDPKTGECRKCSKVITVDPCRNKSRVPIKPRDPKPIKPFKPSQKKLNGNTLD